MNKFLYIVDHFVPFPQSEYGGVWNVIAKDDEECLDVVVSEASKGIATVSRETEVPIVFGVLTTDTMQQALERAGIKNNLGWSYALQALEMGSLMKAVS